MLNLFAVTMVWGCSGTVPKNLGVRDGQLTACPTSPNCVSSQAPVDDPHHYIAPLLYQDDVASARNRLTEVLATLPRNRIVEQSDNYLRVEFSSAVMRFVDDVEFYFTAGQWVHLRSASRLGYSDFGVNRKRIETVRQLFEK